MLSLTATASFDLEAKSADGAPKRPTFRIKGYTGAVMQVAGFYNPVVVDLAGLVAARNKIPIFLDHDPGQIVGQTDNITIDASGVDLTGVITGEDAHAASILAHARNGFEWQASIGASIARQEFLKAGEKAVVNGREVAGPLLIAREARLFETSFVAVGADSQTTAAVAARSSPPALTKGATMFEQWLVAKGIDPAALTEPTRAILQASHDAEQAAAKEKEKEGSKSLSLDLVFAKHEEEQTRRDRITQLADQAMEHQPDRRAEFKKLAAKAIEAKFEVRDFELELLRLERTSPSFAIHSTGQQTAPKMLEAAICQAGGLRDMEKQFDVPTLEAAHREFPRGLGLVELILQAARENGYRGHTASDLRTMLRAAFGADGRTVRADGFSTMSLPGIMSNVANKFLRVGFDAVESGWREIAAIRAARDFKTISTYTLTGGMKYLKVAGDGELKHAEVGETSYTNKVDTYGRMFSVTRQDLINDDLGALTDVPRRLGRGAALALNEAFWTEFLADAGTFFTSPHGNVSTGAGSALSSAGLETAAITFALQTDPDGFPLGIEPRILLVPRALEITADQLMTSLIVNTGGASTTDRVPNANVWANKYRTLSSSYLSNSNITGYSTAAWYLLADPSDLAMIEVAFLNGREEPVVESADADFDTLGIQMRGYFDFGVKKQEYRAAVRSAGS